MRLSLEFVSIHLREGELRRPSNLCRGPSHPYKAFEPEDSNEVPIIEGIQDARIYDVSPFISWFCYNGKEPKLQRAIDGKWTDRGENQI